MPSKPSDTDLSPATRVKVPDHVVFRAFPAETVVLNLQSGTYHGLNPTAGRMLEVLGEQPAIGDAAVTIATEYEIDADIAEQDLLTLCTGLIQRDLLTIVSDG